VNDLMAIKIALVIIFTFFIWMWFAIDKIIKSPEYLENKNKEYTGPYCIKCLLPPGSGPCCEGFHEYVRGAM